MQIGIPSRMPSRYSFLLNLFHLPLLQNVPFIILQDLVKVKEVINFLWTILTDCLFTAIIPREEGVVGAYAGLCQHSGVTPGTV